MRKWWVLLIIVSVGLMTWDVVGFIRAMTGITWAVNTGRVSGPVEGYGTGIMMVAAVRMLGIWAATAISALILHFFGKRHKAEPSKNENQDRVIPSPSEKSVQDEFLEWKKTHPTSGGADQ